MEEKAEPGDCARVVATGAAAAAAAVDRDGCASSGSSSVSPSWRTSDGWASANDANAEAFLLLRDVATEPAFEPAAVEATVLETALLLPPPALVVEDDGAFMASTANVTAATFWWW